MAVATCALVVGALLAPTPAQAQDSVTQVSSAGSPQDGMYLSYVGCESFASPAAAPSTRINLGPDTAPMGRRSFGLVPTGAGSASGPVLNFSSLTQVGAELQVRADAGTRGVSYVWVTTDDILPGLAWRGRADLSVPAGAWTTVQTATTSYTWDLVDLATGSTVATESGTPGDFADRHGTGPGYVVTGFGCEGNPFHIDAVRGNGRVWDFEGLSLTTSIVASAQRVPAGQDVVLTGSVGDAAGRTTGDPLVLQSRVPGTGEWTDASKLTFSNPENGLVTVTTRVSENREFRWFRPESTYADAGWSEPVLVEATGVPPSQPTTAPTSKPSPESSPEPSSKPSSKPSPEPSSGPTTEPSSQPSSQPSSEPSPAASTEPAPSAEPSAEASAQPTSAPPSDATTEVPATPETTSAPTG